MLFMTGHDAHVQALRDWITQIMVQQRLTATEIAREAGLSASTLTRFMSPDGHGGVLSDRTLTKIEQRFNAVRPRQVREPLLSSEPTQRLMDFADHIAGANDHLPGSVYSVRDRALDLAGYMPEDIVLVDRGALPANGDVIALRWRTKQTPAGQITLRIYDAPFLTAHSTDESLRRPVLLDPETIQVLGVVYAAMRARRSA